MVLINLRLWWTQHFTTVNYLFKIFPPTFSPDHWIDCHFRSGQSRRSACLSSRPNLWHSAPESSYPPLTWPSSRWTHWPCADSAYHSLSHPSAEHWSATLLSLLCSTAVSVSSHRSRSYCRYWPGSAARTTAATAHWSPRSDQLPRTHSATDSSWLYWKECWSLLLPTTASLSSSCGQRHWETCMTSRSAWIRRIRTRSSVGCSAACCYSHLEK